MTGWTLVYEDFDPARERLREALCTLGNGYVATRGAAEEARADERHYPGTYLAGGYDRLDTVIAGRTIENEDLVNWPNWLILTFRPQGEAWFDLAELELLAYRQELHLEAGILERHVRVRDRAGRQTIVQTRRLVHMGDRHLAALEVRLTAANWSGTVEIRSALDGQVQNAGVERYRALRGDHLEPLRTERVGSDGMLLWVRTRSSRIEMAQAARTRAFDGETPLAVEGATIEAEGLVEQRLTFELEAGRPVRVEKVVAIFTSRDRAIANCVQAAVKALDEVTDGFAELVRDHAQAWARLWHRCDVGLAGDERTQLILRLHLFHLLQTVSIHTIDLDAGVPARGLHGEAYRGHVFWDELFIFPFLNLRMPEITRALLLYRYRRLPEARRAAARAGYAGAMYPWQSGSDGREETQVLHLNPESGRWRPDHTHLQRHINAAIVFNVWQYYQATRDEEFMALYGVEMVIEIARCLASLASYDAQKDRYVIRGVMGPDEYHDAYPEAEQPGLDNNAYTNVMVVWVLWRVLDMLGTLPDDRHAELCGIAGCTDEELERWDVISRRMYVPFHDGIISQFEGYERLEEFNWEGYRRRYATIRRLDRILEAEGDSPNRYKISKQADVLMLFYLFSSEELSRLFARLGYRFEYRTIPRNIEYYLARTSDGSTLSSIVRAWLLARSGRAESWPLFRQALESDVADVQGGTTPEGIHLGAMAGTVDMVQRAYTGIEIRDDVLWLNPRLPAALRALRLDVRYRAHWIRVDVDRDSLRVEFEKGWHRIAKVGFRGRIYEFRRGESRTFDLAADDGAAPDARRTR